MRTSGGYQHLLDKALGLYGIYIVASSRVDGSQLARRLSEHDESER